MLNMNVFGWIVMTSIEEWLITGLVSLLLGIIWYATREWIKGVKNGFLRLSEKLDDLIRAIDKIELHYQLQNEQLTNLITQVEKQEQQLGQLEQQVREIEHRQLVCENYKINKM